MADFSSIGGVPVQKGKLDFSSVENVSHETIGEAIKNAVMDIIKKPAAAIKDVATNPRTMANVLPAVAGTAGAISPIPGGATLGTVAGRQISNEVLRLLGHPEDIPSGGSQLGEAALSAVGDVVAIPAIKGKIFGSQIGKAEKASGVVTRAPLKLPTAGNVGTALDELETTLRASLQSGKPLGPQSARDAYAVANYVAGNPQIVGKSNEIAVQAARVRALSQAALNASVPGRLAPAQSMAKAMTIPNAIGRTYNKLPSPVRTGLGLGAGTATGGGLVYELGKRLLGR